MRDYSRHTWIRSHVCCIATTLLHHITSHCIEPCKVRETLVVVWLTICVRTFEHVFWLLSAYLISSDPFVLFGVLLWDLMWWRFAPWLIVPWRDLGPRVCGRHVIVLLGARRCLITCGWNYTIIPFGAIFEIDFSSIYSLRGWVLGEYDNGLFDVWVSGDHGH